MLRKTISVTCKSCKKIYEKRADTMKQWSGLCKVCTPKLITNKGKYRTRKSCSSCGVYSRYIKASGQCRKCWKPAMAGENHYNWKGGITPLNYAIRRSYAYKLWRRAVFGRDDYKCQFCGSSGYLEADHIKMFAFYPELRFDINNGRTLCKECHMKTPTYKKHKLVEA